MEIKAILQFLELSSILKVNFHKNQLVGINRAAKMGFGPWTSPAHCETEWIGLNFFLKKSVLSNF